MNKTPWFENVKPVHNGVYEIKHPDRPNVCVYQHWDGKLWGMYMPSIRLAWDWRDKYSGYQDQPWRGLADKPND